MCRRPPASRADWKACVHTSAVTVRSSTPPAESGHLSVQVSVRTSCCQVFRELASAPGADSGARSKETRTVQSKGSRWICVSERRQTDPIKGRAAANVFFTALFTRSKRLFIGLCTTKRIARESSNSRSVGLLPRKPHQRGASKKPVPKCHGNTRFYRCFALRKFWSLCAMGERFWF